MLDLPGDKKDVQAEEGRKMQNRSRLHGIFPFVGWDLPIRTNVTCRHWCLLLYSSPPQEAKDALAGMI